MTDRVLKVLEFDKIRSMLADCAVSVMGREFAEKLRPVSDYEAAACLQEETAEAEAELIRTGRSPVDSFPDVRASLRRSGVTLALGPGELLAIARALRAARFAREALCEEGRTGVLTNMAAALFSARALEEEIFRCILSEDEIADSASPALSDLRRRIRGCNDRVRDKLNAILHSSTYKNCLMDPIITMRNGRYVLPVKQEYRSAIPGLLHDQSGSGATLFIEPAAVVEIGNELKKLLSEEQEEIQRILSALTQRLAPDAQALLATLDVLAELDTIFAKAKLARAMKAVRPELNSAGYLRIVSGRHPLISADAVVPIDVWLGREFRTLIITGPNTGGKTGTLKTVGLFTLMAQAGLFVPAQSGTELSVFERVFADIGDEQSIEQSLSTFSSHMKNIVDLLKEADEHSLVLVDELGSGTDPVEGAALAMSVLEELHDRRTRTLATTHYSELKAFALTHEGMENACMEFDLATLRPTYRLYVGIPGKSNAFEISKKLGLPEHIIENAKKHLSGRDISFEDAISGAESQRRIAEEERRLAEEARAELYRLRDETERERKKVADQREKALKRAREESRAILQNAREESERIIKELRLAQAEKSAGQSRAVQKARDELRSAAEKLQDSAAENDALAAAPPPKTVAVGDVVRLIRFGSDATVVTPPDAKGELTVAAGVMKMNVRLSDIRPVRQDAKKKQKKTASTASVQRSSVANSLEIDVRGQTVEEAILEVDRYLDTAFLSGLHEISIIHGKGTGALRAGLHDYLKRNKHVKTFRLGAFGEGEAGVTVVTLK